MLKHAFSNYSYMTLHQTTMLPLLIFCLCHSMGHSSKVEKVNHRLSQFCPWGIESLRTDRSRPQPLINVYERQRGRNVPP